MAEDARAEDLRALRLAQFSVEQAAEPVFWVDHEARIIYANQAICRLLGFTRAELESKSVPDIDPSSVPDDWHRFWAQVRDEGSARFETECLTSDGHLVPLEIIANFLESDGQEYTCAFARDITVRRQAESALRAEQARYRALFDDNPTMFFTLDVDGTVLSVNRYGCEQLGYAAEELVGQSVLHVFHGQDRPFVRQQLAECVRHTDRVARWEFRKTRKDGSMLWVKEAARAVHNADGETVVLIVCEDITDRKQAEQELARYRDQLEDLVHERTAELMRANTLLQAEIAERRHAQAALAAEKERLAVTLRSMGEGVIVTDAEGLVVLMNGVAEILTGWSEADALGQPLGLVFRVVQEHTREAMGDPVSEVRRKGRITQLASHMVLIGAGGSERIVADSAAPVRDRMGDLVGVVVVFRDITERRRIEAELLKTQKLESIGVLAGGLAHDFNNLLTVILGNLSMMRLGLAAADPAISRLDVSEKACLQARSLADQLLTFSKGGAPRRRPTDIGAVIRDSAAFVLRGSNVRCAFDLEDGLWPADVDEGQIGQALGNVVLNADQAMPEGGVVRVTAANATVKGDEGLPLRRGRYVRITIRDTGVGIPAEHLAKIFDPYFTSKQRGSGLGLTIAYSVIHNHDGAVFVTSDLGSGTVIEVYLPATEHPIAPAESRAPGSPVGGGRVLVMDDDALVRETLRAMLDLIGYEVTVAGEGTEAVDLYRQAKDAGQPFEVVILDLTVPGGVGGSEALERLKSIDPDVKAIVSSGYSNDPVMADHEAYGFIGVVSKPYKVEDLTRVLGAVLGEVE